MPMPQPGPTAATRKPANTAPSVMDALMTRLLSALACCRRGSLTTSGVRPIAAGRKNASQTPMPTWMRARCHTCATPAIRSAAVSVWSTKRMKSPASITRCRGSLSAHTPPMSRKTASGTRLAASTMPISVAVPPISSTAKGRATTVNMTPTTDVACPKNSLRNSDSRSTAKLSASLLTGASYSDVRAADSATRCGAATPASAAATSSGGPAAASPPAP